MAKGKMGKNLRAEDFNVGEADRPGWARGTTGFAVRQNVYCAGGEGTIVSVHGKTSDGSRLLEIRLPDEKASFFASSSNVLFQSEAAN